MNSFLQVIILLRLQKKPMVPIPPNFNFSHFHVNLRAHTPTAINHPWKNIGLIKGLLNTIVPYL